MSATPQRLMVVGANHRSASLGLRDVLYIDDAAAPSFLIGLREAGLAEAMVLSTCDRVEVWCAAADPALATHAVSAAFAAKAGLTSDGLQAHLYSLSGADAVRHGFGVVAALDSLVIGEPHVAGQVKAAYRLAREADTVGGVLDQFTQAAFAVAKRVRSETAVGEGPVSIAAAAVQVARDLHGDLATCRALVIGTGDMGGLVAESLLAAGLTDMLVTAPRDSRAESLAHSLGCHVLPFDDLREALAGADVVLTCVGGRNPVVSAEAVALALRKRRRQPIFLIDAGIPGDVETAVNRIESAFLYDLADLEKVALEGRATREHAARAARAIVEAEVAHFLRGRAARAAVPALVALREQFEATRAGVLAEIGSDVDPAEATRLLVNRLLHVPTETMKSIAAEGEEWKTMEATLRKLFHLEE
ncbi:glutamyl-tRNA reductase [Phaeospirillum tilakii]|uniref:Glutamyl-tRNA reductase n=1 Tax=Phaeospirillum tilakii TaxID=741673 RepID=A0ABW5CB32_9PROT